MTQLGPAQVALFLAQQGEELVRIWRLARATARPEVFPGLLDGVVAEFFARAGELLARGAPAAEVWRGLGGVVRWPTTVDAAELDAEWVLVEQVLAATCESVNAAPEVSGWLLDAVGGCRLGLRELWKPGAAPEAIVTALVFSSVAPPPSRHGEDDTVS
ncbi:hypothetical protein [Anaeromyxobacter diazotrophicus]|uniref:Uncharacterized protein n=1 Tax=Anaeromyxobacter diazotrophicus TaxID=2590199 RepID=A0A7I9VJW5_9BACT|nr:hypothetical protein [Anaeromyxobacter diazotrophicus]GEJ56692.1 hypothetical protein AMYX_14330 [Anaeromyxobacter diazotrophicus]